MEGKGEKRILLIWYGVEFYYQYFLGLIVCDFSLGNNRIFEVNYVQ